MIGMTVKSAKQYAVGQGGNLAEVTLAGYVVFRNGTPPFDAELRIKGYDPSSESFFRLGDVYDVVLVKREARQ